MLKGIGASHGYGIGKIVKIEEADLTYEERRIENTEEEIKRFRNAVDTFSERTMSMAEDMRSRVGGKEAEILEGHVMMVQDPFLTDEVTGKIKTGICAERALEEVCEMFIQMFSADRKSVV